MIFKCWLIIRLIEITKTMGGMGGMGGGGEEVNMTGPVKVISPI